MFSRFKGHGSLALALGGREFTFRFGLRAAESSQVYVVGDKKCDVSDVVGKYVFCFFLLRDAWNALLVQFGTVCAEASKSSGGFLLGNIYNFADQS